MFDPADSAFIHCSGNGKSGDNDHGKIDWIGDGSDTWIAAITEQLMCARIDGVNCPAVVILYKVAHYSVTQFAWVGGGSNNSYPFRGKELI